MNNLPRQTLCEIIAQYGRSLCDDPRRTEALLRDFCGAHKREIFCLVSALKERVAADLLASQDGVPQEILLARLAKRLRDNMALTEDAARWTVESWALALGQTSSAESETWGMGTNPLHLIWIVGCSSSMEADGKIQALNYAIRNVIPDMRKVADENPNAEVLLRAIKFSCGAQWHIFQPTPIADFEWMDLSAEGPCRDMGKAISMVADQLEHPPMPRRALPPVLVLVSDGPPTDDFSTGLRTLMEQPWGKEAVRIAIPIGEDVDREVLQEFIGHPELEPLQANNSESLVKYIKWVSVDIPFETSNETTTWQR